MVADILTARVPAFFYAVILIPVFALGIWHALASFFSVRVALLLYLLASLPGGFIIYQSSLMSVQRFLLFQAVLVLPITLATAWVISQLPRPAVIDDPMGVDKIIREALQNDSK